MLTHKNIVSNSTAFLKVTEVTIVVILNSLLSKFVGVSNAITFK